MIRALTSQRGLTSSVGGAGAGRRLAGLGVGRGMDSRMYFSSCELSAMRYELLAGYDGNGGIWRGSVGSVVRSG